LFLPKPDSRDSFNQNQGTTRHKQEKTRPEPGSRQGKSH
jgi:hypothetical protein